MPSQERGRRKRLPYKRIIGGPREGVSLDVVREVVQEETEALAFTELTDAPPSYTGKAFHFVVVRDDEEALVFMEAGAALADAGLAIIEGSGTAGRVPVFTSASEIEDSRVVVDGSTGKVSVPALNTDSSVSTLHVGSDESWMEWAAFVAETYSGNGVVGAAETGTGTKGVSVSGTGGHFISQASQSPALHAANPNGPGLLLEGGLVAPAARAINANLTLTGRQHIIEVSTTTAAVALTLPTRAAWNDGIVYHIFDVGNNAATAGRSITVNRSGTDTFLDAATSKTLATNRGHWRIVGVTNTAGTRGWYIERAGGFGV